VFTTRPAAPLTLCFTQDEIRIDTEMKHRELREVGWDWSYSTKEAHNFLCHVTELRRYYSQVRSPFPHTHTHHRTRTRTVVW
jgi:hypothetical protein